jgi:hypothetical protein
MIAPPTDTNANYVADVADFPLNSNTISAAFDPTVVCLGVQKEI